MYLAGGVRTIEATARGEREDGQEILNWLVQG